METSSVGRFIQQCFIFFYFDGTRLMFTSLVLFICLFVRFLFKSIGKLQLQASFAVMVGLAKAMWIEAI